MAFKAFLRQDRAQVFSFHRNLFDIWYLGRASLLVYGFMVVYSFELGSMAFSCNYFHKLFHHRIYICQEIRIQQVVSSHEHWALFLCSLIYRWLILQKVNYLEYRFYLYFLLALDLLISRRTCFCILTGLQMECFYLNF